jgi:hypothetical protein
MSDEVLAEGLFFGRVLLAGALVGVFDRLLVPLVADAVSARAFLAVAVVREDGILRDDFFAATLAGFFFDVAIGSATSPPVAGCKGRPGGSVKRARPPPSRSPIAPADVFMKWLTGRRHTTRCRPIRGRARNGPC